MDVAGTILEMRKVFGQDGEHWCTGNMKKRSQGTTQYCLVGAGLQATGKGMSASRLPAPLARALFLALPGKHPYRHKRDATFRIIGYNDSHTWSDVDRVLQTALRNAEAKDATPLPVPESTPLDVSGVEAVAKAVTKRRELIAA